MKKIMFNDKYGLTKAVLEGRKTQTRRICAFGSKPTKKAYRNLLSNYKDGGRFNNELLKYSTYKVGEEVAIAQSYSSIMRYYHSLGNFRERKIEENEQLFWNYMREIESTANNSALRGDSNKMFVRADLMPHRIRITNVRVEQLQDISYEDCLNEGLSISSPPLQYMAGYWADHTDRFKKFDTPKEAFAAIIDKTCGRGTWQSNPYVFVYDFELIK